MIIIEAKNIVKQFEQKDSNFMNRSYLTAVNNVSLAIEENTTIGIVGESGSGKSTFGEILGDLQIPNSGHIFYEGKDIRSLTKEEYLDFRRNVQFIFQNPQGSMNPYYKIVDVLLEPMKTLLPDFNRTKALQEINKMMVDVGLDESYLSKYASQLSGGQCQRVAIARALLLKPKVIVCDEAVSALDVSVQAQILNLLKELKKTYQTSLLFISHDIAVVKYISDKVMVLYRGDMVEYGSVNEVINHPQHDYTKKLLHYVSLKGA